MSKPLTLTKQYTPYDRYTDSGVEWLGQVPEGWDVLKFNYAFSYKKGKNPSELYSEKLSGKSYYTYLSMTYLRGEPIPTYCKLESGLVFAERDDILLLWDGSNAGEFLMAKEGVVSSTMSKITGKSGVNKMYSAYLLKAFEKILKTETIGMGIPHVDGNFLKNMFFTFPPLPTQQHIATYLDEKTEKIDRIIAGKKQLVELLEEKRKSVISEAVEGVGDEVKRERLKFIAPLRNSKVAQQNSNERYVGLEHVSSWKGTLLNIQGGQQSAEGIVNRFKNGDVLFGKLRPYLAKAFVADFQGVCTGELLVMTPNKDKLLPKYLLNMVLSEKFLDMVNNSTYGAKMPRASWDFIGNLEIEYPSLEKQKEIIYSLEAQTQKIDKLIKKVKQSIKLLTEYKSSLISHVVTGRVKV